MNNTANLRLLTPHIMPSYTHKMANVSWPLIAWRHFTPCIWMNTFICNKCRKKQIHKNYTKEGYKYSKNGQITRPSITYSQNATKQHLSSYECCNLLHRICQWYNSQKYYQDSRAYFCVYYYTKCVLLKAGRATLKKKMCNIKLLR